MAPGWARVVNAHNGGVYLERAWMADYWTGRLTGLLGRRRLGEGEGIWLSPCGGIHTLFMIFPIDVAFLDATGRVLRVAEGVPPFWMKAGPRGTASVVESRSGWAAKSGLRAGDDLKIIPLDE